MGMPFDEVLLLMTVTSQSDAGWPTLPRGGREGGRVEPIAAQLDQT